MACLGRQGHDSYTIYYLICDQACSQFTGLDAEAGKQATNQPATVSPVQFSRNLMERDIYAQLRESRLGVCTLRIKRLLVPDHRAAPRQVRAHAAGDCKQRGKKAEGRHFESKSLLGLGWGSGRRSTLRPGLALVRNRPVAESPRVT